MIFATNVAETSITLPNVRMVIDSGLNKMLHFDPLTLSTELQLVRLSKHQVTQRIGQTGRTSDREAVHCYSKEEFDLTPKLSPRPLSHANLTPILPKLLSAGFQVDKFHWFTRPFPEQFVLALGCLTDYDLVKSATDNVSLTENDISLTEKGKIMSQLDLTPEQFALFDYVKPTEDCTIPVFTYNIQS
jgi:HrpA-like RNA helicase